MFLSKQCKTTRSVYVVRTHVESVGYGIGRESGVGVGVLYVGTD